MNRFAGFRLGTSARMSSEIRVNNSARTGSKIRFEIKVGNGLEIILKDKFSAFV